MNRQPFLCRRPVLRMLVAVGAALRIYPYASDTSLWYEELSMVRNLVHRSESRLLLEPLGDAQVSPTGFMVAEKAISRVLDPERLEAASAERFPLSPEGPLNRPCDERVRPLR